MVQLVLELKLRGRRGQGIHGSNMLLSRSGGKAVSTEDRV
jgi:hypothetical protein